MVFVDGILLYSKTPEDHVHHLRIVLEVFKKNELHAKTKKGELWLQEVAFLGHAVFKDRIFME